MRLWRTSLARLLIWTTVLGSIACGSRGVEPTAVRENAGTPGGAAGDHPPSLDEAIPLIVALGDSLTAGLGLPPDEAYPTRIQNRIEAAGFNYRVVNAGVSGDTSAGGLSRLDWVLEGHVRILIVALGGNDALRALPVEELHRNLSLIIERAQARGITVILAGMQAPPNYGPAYTTAFRQVYPALARKYNVALIPFFLKGVAGEVTLNQADGIHPNAQGATMIADHVWVVLEPILREFGPGVIRYPASRQP
ncbi:MAG: arylesterase [Acidobacteria bacterium]|nr:arylesterase [Acidobacteriota bacterium]